MKFIRITILVIAVISFLPLDGFCDDHQSAQEHHCIVACHSCHQMVSPETALETFSPEQSSHISFNYAFQYQAPVLDQTHRPPIVSL